MSTFPDGHGHIVILGYLIKEPIPVSLSITWHSLQEGCLSLLSARGVDGRLYAKSKQIEGGW